MSLHGERPIVGRSVAPPLMKWYYESNGLPRGPVSENELRRMREEGKLLEDALVWCKGMGDWAPIHSLRELYSGPQLPSITTAAVPSINPPVAPRPQTKALAAETIPSGAPGHFSPPSLDLPRIVPPEEDDEDKDEQDEDEPLLDEPLVRGSAQPEWEHLGRTGPVGAYILSLKEILLEPRQTFFHLSSSGGWGLPLSFLLISEVLANTFMVLTLKQIPITSPAPAFLLMLRQSFPVEASGSVLLLSIAASVCMLPLVVMVKCMTLHIPIKLIAGSNHSLATTFRTMCYAMGAGSMLWGIPLAAVSIATASNEADLAAMALFFSLGATAGWAIYVNLRALASAHQISMIRTTLAVLVIPFLLGVMILLLLGAIATLA